VGRGRGRVLGLQLPTHRRGPTLLEHDEEDSGELDHRQAEEDVAARRRAFLARERRQGRGHAGEHLPHLLAPSLAHGHERRVPGVHVARVVRREPVRSAARLPAEWERRGQEAGEHVRLLEVSEVVDRQRRPWSAIADQTRAVAPSQGHGGMRLGGPESRGRRGWLLLRGARSADAERAHRARRRYPFWSPFDPPEAAHRLGQCVTTSKGTGRSGRGLADTDF
jgi:hypothetical protein